MSSAYENKKREHCLKELMTRYKTLGSSIIHYVSEQNNFDVRKASMALLELTGEIRVTREYSRPPRLENPDQYISVTHIEDCIDDILIGGRILIILRGLPGSGKSYLAKSILRACYPVPNYKDHIFSADNFFMHNGKYEYDARQIGDAHQWNQKQVDYRMQEGYSPLMVDNTNTRMWEMSNYLNMAVRNGYKIHVLEMNTRWAFNCNELTKRNQHNVPKQTIKAMLERYEMGISAESLLNYYQYPLTYQENPVKRRCPPFFASNEPSYNSLNPDLSLPRSKKKAKGVNRINNGAYSFYDQNEEVSTSTISKNLSSVAQQNTSEIVNQNGLSHTEQKTKTLNSSIGLCPFTFSWETDLDEAAKFWSSSPPSKPDDEVFSIPEKKPCCEVGVNTSTDNFVDTEILKIIYGRSREICDTRKTMTRNKPGMLDKSCSTHDVVFSNREEDLKKLIDIFEKVPPSYIKDMYDDCQGNFDMTFEIFLEDNKDYSYLNLNNENTNDVREQNEECELTRKMSEESLNEACALPQEVPETPKTAIPKSSENEVSTSTGAIRKNTNMPSFKMKENKVPVVSFDEENMYESPLSDYDSDNSTTSKLEFDNIELNLGQFLVKQLEKEFGDPSNNFPDGFQPVVQVPKGLARQLYAFYVESAYQQMETQQSILDDLVKEDEAFARKLYEEEMGVSYKPPPEGLQEIMNEQAAMKIHKKQLPKLKTPNDLATLLTKKKLFNSFPSVDQGVIMEIYHANDLDYKQTVDDLMNSVGAIAVSSNANIREPPLSPSTVQDMEKAQKDSKPTQVEKEEKRTPKQYREDAEYYLGKRNELYQKAQEHYNRGQREVAQFYSQLAKQQTQYYDIANNKAASVFLDENSRQLQNLNTLDLHYLFVKEALSALDVFIDSNINQLNSSKSKLTQDLLIITGRGKRSLNGVSKIRPAVIRRLEARNIKYHKMNPGLLKIKIKWNTPVTNDL